MLKITFTKDRYYEITDMCAWCKNNVGDGGWLDDPNSWWSIESAFGRSTFQFKREQDLMMFLLRWA